MTTFQDYMGGNVSQYSILRTLCPLRLENGLLKASWFAFLHTTRWPNGHDKYLIGMKYLSQKNLM